MVFCRTAAFRCWLKMDDALRGAIAFAAAQVARIMAQQPGAGIWRCGSPTPCWRALAGALDLTFQQVQKYESGKNRISASRLQRFSQILKVPVAFFFEGAPGGADAAPATPDYVNAHEIMVPETLSGTMAWASRPYLAGGHGEESQNSPHEQNQEPESPRARDAMIRLARGRSTDRRIPLPPECLPRAACLGGDGGIHGFSGEEFEGSATTHPCRSLRAENFR
jgi:transcriptional regulator with XRE-family HTH domain